MSIQISPETETLLAKEARRQGLSVDALLQRLIVQFSAGTGREVPELPVLHLGPMGPLHRRDIYDDAR